MPVIAVNLSQKTYSDIMTLVAAGAYSGPEQFLEIAAFNQLALERGLTPEELQKTIHSPASVAEESESFSARSGKTKRQHIQKITDQNISAEPAVPVKRRSVVVGVDDGELRNVLSRFSLQQCKELKLELSAAPANTNAERVWGQVNRLLPLKAACRWIAAAASSTGRWPEMAFAIERLAPDAGILGSALEKADSQNARKREEMMGTGLPRKGNLQSSDRFLSQFVGRMTRTGRTYPGVISQYGLATVSADSLQLTKWGFDFACIENQILDGNLRIATRTLSEDERAFLVRQVWERVQTEKQDFMSVLRRISGGDARPELLMSGTRSDFPAKWTDVALRTHIYGIVARLGELGLVTKTWDGRSVEYKIADSARKLLAA
jgi:hypothetical protein